MVVNCKICRHLRCNEEEIWHKNRWEKPLYYVKSEYAYSCGALYLNLRNLNRCSCSRYMPVLMSLDRYMEKHMEERNLVRLEEIPQEKDRVDLSQLPFTAQLIAVSEEMVQPETGKTGGLLIRYKMLSDGDFKDMDFPQKYSAMSGTVLYQALNKLGLKDTIDLQTTVCEYKLTPMRTGFPRYIPVKIVKRIGGK